MAIKQRTTQIDRWLFVLLTYYAASLFHFAHNAVFVDDYPNFPVWISGASICGTWLAITGVGIVGYFLVRRGNAVAGLFTLGIYGAFGLDGLSHYTLAPVSAHSFTMNLSIWTEAVSALMVLICVTVSLSSELRNSCE